MFPKINMRVIESRIPGLPEPDYYHPGEAIIPFAGDSQRGFDEKKRWLIDRGVWFSQTPLQMLLVPSKRSIPVPWRTSLYMRTHGWWATTRVFGECTVTMKQIKNLHSIFGIGPFVKRRSRDLLRRILFGALSRNSSINSSRLGSTSLAGTIVLRLTGNPCEGIDWALISSPSVIWKDKERSGCLF